MEENNSTQENIEEVKTEDPKPEPTTQTTVAQSGPPTAKKKSKRKWIIVAVVIVLILGIGGFFILQTPDFGSSEPSPTPQIEELPTPPSTPTPEPVDKSEVSILILNGTGIEGEATLLKENLEDLGYEDIEAENADDTDNEVTIVIFDTNLSDAIRDEILAELIDTYQDVESSTDDLGEFDVEITTGLRTGQTPIPEETETPEATEEPSETESPTPTPTSE